MQCMLGCTCKQRPRRSAGGCDVSGACVCDYYYGIPPSTHAVLPLVQMPPVPMPHNASCVGASSTTGTTAARRTGRRRRATSGTLWALALVPGGFGTLPSPPLQRRSSGLYASHPAAAATATCVCDSPSGLLAMLRSRKTNGLCMYMHGAQGSSAHRTRCRPAYRYWYWCFCALPDTPSPPPLHLACA